MRFPAQHCLSLAFVALICSFPGCAALGRNSQPTFAPAFDSSAPIISVSPDESAPTDSTYQPAGSATPKLSFLEPYQPGKVPVVLIHGLASSPVDWADAIGYL